MQKFSLNAKVVFIMLILIAGSIAIAFTGLNKMGDIQENLDVISNTLVPRVLVANDVRGGFRQIVIFEKNFILSDSPEELAKFEKLLEDAHARFKENLEGALKIASEQGRVGLTNIQKEYQAWLPVHAETMRLTREGKNKEASQISMTKGATTRQAIEAEVKELIESNKKRVDEKEHEAAESYGHARTLTIVLSLIAILLGAAVAAFVLRAVSATINKVISQLQDSSAQVSTAAEQISSSSEELSQAATEQAASLEETAASVEEISSMVQKNAENAKKASAMASSSHDSANKGKEVVESMIAAIQEINASNNEISEIVKVIGEIGNKTKVINDIVFQTKLLSFNASVEAARAGEHGKGFAVVAEEVGNLAQMSGNAAKEISSMLEGSIQKVERLVATSRDKVDVGTRVAGECGEVLDEIVSNVATVTAMASEIAKASDEQSRGIGEITRAMSQLDQVTQQNASSSEEAASSAEELSAQAVALRDIVGDLISAIKGGEQHSSNHPRVVAKVPTLAPRRESRKVIHINEAAGRRPTRTGKGASLTTAPATTATERVLKKAVGAHNHVPDGNDPRFEEV